MLKYRDQIIPVPVPEQGKTDHGSFFIVERIKKKRYNRIRGFSGKIVLYDQRIVRYVVSGYPLFLVVVLEYPDRGERYFLPDFREGLAEVVFIQITEQYHAECKEHGTLVAVIKHYSFIGGCFTLH